MLSYAWDNTLAGEEQSFGSDNFEDSENLYAALISHSLEYIFRRGLYKNYLVISEEIPGIKGKLFFNESIKQNSFSKTQQVL